MAYDKKGAVNTTVAFRVEDIRFLIHYTALALPIHSSNNVSFFIDYTPMLTDDTNLNYCEDFGVSNSLIKNEWSQARLISCGTLFYFGTLR